MDKPDGAIVTADFARTTSKRVAGMFRRAAGDADYYELLQVGVRIGPAVPLCLHVPPVYPYFLPFKVTPDATPEQIKKQYYMLARKYHPGTALHTEQSCMSANASAGTDWTIMSGAGILKTLRKLMLNLQTKIPGMRLPMPSSSSWERRIRWVLGGLRILSLLFLSPFPFCQFATKLIMADMLGSFTSLPPPQVLCNPQLREQYDKHGKKGLDVDFMDTGAFFNMLFGSDMFEPYVGELLISMMAGCVWRGSWLGEGG